MSDTEPRTVLGEIASHFEALATQIEQAIEAFAQDESGAVDLGALHRARDEAQRGASIARSASSESQTD